VKLIFSNIAGGQDVINTNDNSLVVSMEINGTMYQGVLFALANNQQQQQRQD
jgi:hypothetical protein